MRHQPHRHLPLKNRWKGSTNKKRQGHPCLFQTCDKLLNSSVSLGSLRLSLGSLFVLLGSLFVHFALVSNRSVSLNVSLSSRNVGLLSRSASLLSRSASLGSRSSRSCVSSNSGERNSCEYSSDQY